MNEGKIFKEPVNPDQDIVSSEKIPLADDYIETLQAEGLEGHAEAYQKVIELSQAVGEAGGRSLLVGGSVRDMVFGKISKDYDIEIYGLEAQQVEEIVARFGKVSDVGKAFGILKIFLGQGIDIDVSLPRTDSKIGEGHRGFEVKTDPNMSIAEAAKRRDFTMNSVAADPLTGELFDAYGGVEDIKNRTLKITDPERFRDDPLRVMRALQFIGRFGLQLDPDSAKIIQEMTPELKELPKERIFEEWKKLLLKSSKPSLGLAAGMTLGVFKELHPEFPPLAKTEQDPEWHPEGDAWIHTLMTVDEAAQITREENLDSKESLTVMLATLCHDLGKADTTEIKDGRIISHGHEQAGGEPTKEFLNSVGADKLTKQKVKQLVENHLMPTMLYINAVVKQEKVSDGAIRRLAKRIYPATINELVLVAQADHAGRGPYMDPKHPEQYLMPDGFPAKKWLLKKARELAVEDSKPADLLAGRDLIATGLKPGKDFGQLIELANRLRDEKDFDKRRVLQALYEIIDNAQAIVKLSSLL
ncbi:HD domain-containing protein [Candidatus Parcubacteria bacterium]|jgi:tRNA nucleotidyltransferase (CCA-adding enzyme)|nr:HD domain-containing protein [Candidatus Parcubacteria bacterium]